MGEKKPVDPLAARLRNKAEAQFPADEGKLGEQMSLADSNELIHELRVHQIELEMQNEELRRTLVELEASRERYFDLYDLAPVGYVTISDRGLILEANLTAAGLLGETRSMLVKQPFSRFLLSEDLGGYFQHRKKLFDTGAPQECDLQVLTKGGEVSWVHLETTLAKSPEGAPLIRAAMSDVSKRKLVERLLQDKAKSLETALSKLEAMVALLPICARCRRIRDEKGQWRQLDAYIAQRSDAEFRQEVCEACLQDLGPEAIREPPEDGSDDKAN